MKCLVSMLLCFTAVTNVFASSADSGRCPWKLPFTMTISAMGETQGGGVKWVLVDHVYNEDDTSYFIPASTINYQITIDSALDMRNDTIKYSLKNDTLQFSRLISGMTELQSVMIIFAPGKDSIISLTVSDSIAYSYSSGKYSSTQNFQIYSLLFNDTSILTNDSSFVHHNISFSEQTLNSMPVSNFNFLDYEETYFTATSVTLSSLFRPTTFSNTAAVEKTPPPSSLVINASNGFIVCSFNISDYERSLEIYSPLGVKVTTVVISPGENRASLPHLQPGFYFVRLEGDVRKIYIPN